MHIDSKGGSIMDNQTTIQEVVERLEILSPGQQRQVLDFILQLSGESSRVSPVRNYLNL